MTGWLPPPLLPAAPPFVAGLGWLLPPLAPRFDLLLPLLLVMVRRCESVLLSSVAFDGPAESSGNSTCTARGKLS